MLSHPLSSSSRLLNPFQKDEKSWLPSNRTDQHQIIAGTKYSKKMSEFQLFLPIKKLQSKFYTNLKAEELCFSAFRNISFAPSFFAESAFLGTKGDSRFPKATSASLM